MEYKISDLAEKADVTKRTIHYYVARGILLPPKGSGVNTVYDDDHLQRLLLIKKFQKEFWPLEKIREYFVNHPDGNYEIQENENKPQIVSTTYENAFIRENISGIFEINYSIQNAEKYKVIIDNTKKYVKRMLEDKTMNEEYSKINCNELSLKSALVSGTIIGKYGIFEIEQNFINDTNKNVDLTYTFPMTNKLSIVGFETIIGDKEITAKLKNIEEIQNDNYEVHNNILNSNNNSFSINIGKANINDRVSIKIKFIDEYEITDNKINVVIPTLMEKSYKANIVNKIHNKPNINIDFRINIEKAIEIHKVTSSSHKFDVIQNDDCTTLIVKNYDFNTEVNLDIEYKKEFLARALKSRCKDIFNDIAYITFIPELKKEPEEKEYYFIIDASESMSGDKFEFSKEAIKECLRSLKKGSKFNIINFNDNFNTMSMNSIILDDTTLMSAIDYINDIQTSKGANLNKALKYALYEDKIPRNILLFTDGKVEDEAEVTNLIEKNIKNSRLFTFALDKDINRKNVRKFANIGHGKYQILNPLNEDNIDRIEKQLLKIASLSLVDEYHLKYGISRVLDELKGAESLFDYEYSHTFARVDRIYDQVNLYGIIDGKEKRWQIGTDDIYETDADLELLLEKQIINGLERIVDNPNENINIREKYKKDLIAISCKYGISCKYTTFVLNYEKDNKVYSIPQPKVNIPNINSGSNSFEMNPNEYYDTDLPAILRKKNSVYSKPISVKTENNTDNKTYDKSELVIPEFLKKNRRAKSKDDATEEVIPDKSTQEKLENNIDDLYKEYMEKRKIDPTTYLMFALYYYNIGQKNKKKNIFNIEDLFKYLKAYAPVITSDTTNMILLFLLQQIIEENKRKEIISYLEGNYKKMAETEINNNVSINDIKSVRKIDYAEYKSMIQENNLKENLKEVLRYIIEKTAV